MATSVVSPVTHLIKAVEPLLNSYEELQINQDYQGVFGYVMQLKTNIYIHRRHTRKDLFIPQSVWQATSITALPNISFIEQWLENARESAQKFIDRGEYTTEEKIGGEYQSVKRQYNKWVYFDRKRQILSGTVNPTPTKNKVGK